MDKRDARHLDLTDGKQESPGGDPHRPRIGLWIDEDGCEGTARTIAMSINALWGQPARFVDFKPAEALALADYLNEMAHAAELRGSSD